MIALIVRQYSSRPFIPLSDERRQALQMATEADPVGAWNTIGEGILSEGEVSSALLTALRGWYGELIPAEYLISWAKEHEPRGPWIVAHLIAPDPRNASSRARALVLSFKANSAVWEELYANMVTGIWLGPYSNKIARDLAVAKEWAEDPDPEFRAFGQDVVRELERRLREQKIREEEGEII
jgi:hypothetical protein